MAESRRPFGLAGRGGTRSLATRSEGFVGIADDANTGAAGPRRGGAPDGSGRVCARSTDESSTVGRTDASGIFMSQVPAGNSVHQVVVEPWSRTEVQNATRKSSTKNRSTFLAESGVRRFRRSRYEHQPARPRGLLRLEPRIRRASDRSHRSSIPKGIIRNDGNCSTSV